MFRRNMDMIGTESICQKFIFFLFYQLLYSSSRITLRVTLMSWKLVFVTHGVLFMSRRIVFVTHRVQSVHTSNSERTLANFFTTLGNFLVMWEINNKKRSHTQLDSRKQVIAFQDRVITINIKEAQHPLRWEKQVIDKSSIMLKISTKSMHWVLVWEIGPANNTTRCSRLSKHHLLHAWHLSQLAINLSIDKSKWQIHVNNKSD